jgi:hypothetical protein
MKFNPLVIVMALCVAGEVILNVCKLPVPPIIEHVILVLLGVLVPQESLQPQSTQTVTKTETVTPPESEKP